MIEESTGLLLFSTEEDRMTADALIESIGGGESRGIAVLVPGSWRPTRRWDAENFIAVGTALHKKHGLRVLVCGGRDEQDVIDRVAGGVPGAVSLVDLPQRVLFELFRRVSIVITNDTGPMHIAAAARAPIVAIFGPENPRRYAPGGPENPGEVVSVGVDCAPCVKFTCDDMKCLRGIDAAMVLEAAERLLLT
jgi:ADP-heptose:LPS heptosyltransferase